MRVETPIGLNKITRIPDVKAEYPNVYVELKYLDGSTRHEIWTITKYTDYVELLNVSKRVNYQWEILEEAYELGFVTGEEIGYRREQEWNN